MLLTVSKRVFGLATIALTGDFVVRLSLRERIG